MRKTVIFFDVSVLIAGSLDSKSRTGVYRNVQNILRELKNEGSFEVEYAIGENVGFFPEMRRIISSWDGFLGRFGFFGGSFHRARPKSIDEMREREISLLRANRALYFSPFHKIPDYIPIELHKKCFITVYDLIPIKFPEYFKDNGNISLISTIVRSVTEKMTVFCISECTKRDLLSARPDLHASQIFVSHLAASEMFYPEADGRKIRDVKIKYKIPLKGRYLLSLCTLEPRKNIPAVIRAYKQVKLNPDLDDVGLVLVGARGWLEEELTMETGTIFTGYVPDTDLAALYSGASCFVYPSFYEGFGLPPLEAMQCGVPVVTSNTSSLPEVMGQAGFMVSPNDIPELAQKVCLILTDDKLRSRLQKSALIQANYFNWEKTASILIDRFKAIEE